MPTTHSKITFFAFGVLMLILCGSAVAHADPAIRDCSVDPRNCTAFVPLSNFEGSPRLEQVFNSGDLKDFMNRLFVAAIALGAVLAVLRLAWAGFVYMGTDMWGKKEHAKEIIQDTLIGLFLLLAIWLILKQINPDILKLNVDFSGSSSASGASTPGSSGLAAPATGKTAPASGKTAPTTKSAPVGSASTQQQPVSSPDTGKYWCYQGALGGTYCEFTKDQCEAARSRVGPVSFGGGCTFSGGNCPTGQGWTGSGCSSDPYWVSGSGTYSDLTGAPQGAWCYERSAGVALFANRYYCFQQSSECTSNRGTGGGPCFENNAP